MAKWFAFRRLHSLGPEIVKEVEDRLLTGSSPAKIADWLQKDMGLLTDIKASSLKKNLERYRGADIKNRVMEQIYEKTAFKSVSGIQNKLNALDEMEKLVRIQTTRLQKVLVKEESLPAGMLMKQVSDEARLLKETLVELGKLQLETGIIARAPKKVTGSFTDELGQKREFSWSEEQEQLFKTLEGIEITADSKLISETYRDVGPING